MYSYDIIDSTNEEAKRLIHKGIEGSCFAVAAKTQSGGKGRNGRRWFSPEGNIYLSIALQPSSPLKSVATYAFVAGLAGVETLKQWIPASCNITLKWPNDILVDNKKIAGILLESVKVVESTSWLVVGIGINTHSFPRDVLYPATSLSAVGGKADDNEAILHQYLMQFDRWCKEKAQKGFGVIREAWLGRVEGIGKLIRVRLIDTEKEGIFKGISQEGALMLESNGTIEYITAGDVFLRGDACC